MKSDNLLDIAWCLEYVARCCRGFFHDKTFDAKGEWTVTETANGYTFNRVDTILPDEKKPKKNVQ
ncbi:MAG: hypothetical protein ACTHM5_04335 [Ginsengibacter sp.]